MLSFRDPLGLAAFLLGAVLLIVFQVGAGLLLYGGPGLIPSLSVVVAVGAIALATGLHIGLVAIFHRHAEETLAQIHRSWRWLLLALVGAALFALGWTLWQGFGARAIAQSVGLTLLIALPLLAGGQVLAHLSQGSQWGMRVAIHALTGAALGSLLLGQALFRLGVVPSSTLLGCLVLASAGALCHGRAVAISPGGEG